MHTRNILSLAYLTVNGAEPVEHLEAAAAGALERAVQNRVDAEQADREAIKTLLQRSDVRDIAGKAGMSVDKALTAVSTLQGDDLRQLADQARQVDDRLAGGASTIVISTTTVIIILLLVILIVLIAD